MRAEKNIPVIKFTNEMNELGKKRIPFLFIIDFAMQKPLLYPLSAIDQEELLFDFAGARNTLGICGENNYRIQAAPIPFDDYSLQFAKVQQEIARGNSYLLNLTCSTPITCSAGLRELFYSASAPYKLFLKNNFLCFSPEIFVRISHGIISSFPMKGTIDAEQDNAEQILLNDPKEIAEHYTIVDLIRNDVSIVAKNVRVEKFRYIEEIHSNRKNLLQVSSKITGRLDDDHLSRLGSIITALLPAGSVSGAPKKKTTEIILSTETHHRGYYTGVAGIFDGVNLDSCVLIRYIEESSEGLFYKSGGGITAFSNAQSEYSEMIDKIYLPQSM